MWVVKLRDLEDLNEDTSQYIDLDAYKIESSYYNHTYRLKRIYQVSNGFCKDMYVFPAKKYQNCQSMEELKIRLDMEGKRVHSQNG